jgi:hypothetical protein
MKRLFAAAPRSEDRQPAVARPMPPGVPPPVTIASLWMQTLVHVVIDKMLS